MAANATAKKLEDILGQFTAPVNHRDMDERRVFAAHETSTLKLRQEILALHKRIDELEAQIAQGG